MYHIYKDWSKTTVYTFGSADSVISRPNTKTRCRVVQDLSIERRTRLGYWNYEKYTPFYNMRLTHPCHFTSTKKCFVPLIGIRIRLALFFKVSTLFLNAVVYPFDPFLMECLLKFGFWNAIQESVDYIHHSVVRIKLTTLQWFLESQKQPEIARGQIRTIRGVGITLCWFACWQAKLPLFSWCVVERYHGATTNHQCFNSGLFIRICRCNCCNTPQQGCQVIIIKIRVYIRKAIHRNLKNS